MDPILTTRQWLEKFVIALNICPFAANPYRKGQIRFVLEDSDSEDVLVRTFLTELSYLYETPLEEVETTLIIHPNVLQDFQDYNEFLGLAEKLLKEAGLEGVFQIASFHPDYQFEGTPAGDPANFTNRSPFPMVHILREESVSRAVDHFPEPEQIPEINIERLRQMGEKEIKRLTTGDDGHLSFRSLAE